MPPAALRLRVAGSLLVVVACCLASTEESLCPTEDETMRRNAREQGAALGQAVSRDDVARMVADRERHHAEQAAASRAGLPGLRTNHPDARWFGESPLGLFIHWGISSVHGNADLSWSMIANMGAGEKMTPARYWDLARGFTAARYDPAHWLAPAKANGFRYAVLTVKHHDGFTLWPTHTTPLGVRTSLPGRDLVRDFVDACRLHDLKVGLFYSGPDWYHDQAYRSFNYRSESGRGSSSLAPIPGRPDYDINHQPTKVPAMPTEFSAAYRAYARAQITELLTRYGRIDVLWFDGGSGSDMTEPEIRALQPGIVINNRGNLRGKSGAPFPGDFFTWESGEPVTRPPGWWEQQRIWNSPYWGYTQRNETAYTPTALILRTAARSAAWGGALLLNVGPRSDGTLPAPYYQGMDEISSWMRFNSESLAGAFPMPEGARSNIPVTARPGRWYLHAVAGRTAEISYAPGSQNAVPVSASVLRTGEKVPFTWDGGTLRITFPVPDNKDPHEVIAVVLQPRVEP